MSGLLDSGVPLRNLILGGRFMARLLRGLAEGILAKLLGLQHFKFKEERSDRWLTVVVLPYSKR